MQNIIILFISCFFIFARTYTNDLESVFTNIYLNNVWGTNEQGEGSSGGGSTPNATREYIDFIHKFIRTYNIQTVVDAGCGDWEFSQYIDWSNVQYIGYDIVKFVIEKNIKRFSAPNIIFRHANIIDTDLPPADLLLCKDVCQHLSLPDVKKFAKQFKKYKYCLITDGPTINMYDHLSDFSREIIFRYYGGGEIKTIVLVNNGVVA